MSFRATPPAGSVSPAHVSVRDLPVVAIEPGTQLHVCANECRGACCRYVSLPIDTPTDQDDHESIRWYLMHEDTEVYKYDGDWYLMLHRRCRHLRPDNVCGAYERRPRICRDYDPSDCEHVGEIDYELYFRDDDEYDAWLRKQAEKRSAAAKKGWAKRRASRRKKAAGR